MMRMLAAGTLKVHSGVPVGMVILETAGTVKVHVKLP